MKKPPRPWKKFARIERVELNNGDVKFVARQTHTLADGGALWTIERLAGLKGELETLDDAQKCLDAWWNEFWPVQVKSRRPA